MATIDILLATYNGEAYVRQQVLSIISQDYQDWRLLIHDDGSTDQTVRIITDLMCMDHRIVFMDDGLTFRNPALNFMHLLKSSDADFVCFCDQDDIWFDNKLSCMLKAFPDTKEACVLFSSGYIYMSNSNLLLGKLDYRINNLKELLYVNGGIHGCRSMFNCVMREYMLKFQGGLDMHDHLMALIACSFGRIEYIDTPLLLYRQHSMNVSGNIILSPLKRIIRAFANIKNRSLVVHNVYNTIVDFNLCYQQELNTNDKKLIGAYLDVRNKHLIWRVFQIVKNGFSFRKNGRFNLITKSIIQKYSDEKVQQ